MATSEARILANRANALKSTGPKSVEGKERSRRNALKHGMAGSGVVLPEAQAPQVAQRDAAFRVDLGPKSGMGAFLVRQMAVLSVRMEQAQAQQGSEVASRVRHAVEAFDNDRLDEANRCLREIADDPHAIVQRMRRTPEGVERLILAWRELRADLGLELHPTWTEWHRDRMTHLMGHHADGAGGAGVSVVSRATWGDFVAGFDDGASEADRKREARELLLDRIDEALNELEAHYETLDFDGIAADRASAPDRALVDASKEAALTRRYEAEATRGFFRVLREYRQVEAEAEVVAKAAEAQAALMRKYGHLMGSSRDRVGPAMPSARPAVAVAVEPPPRRPEVGHSGPAPRGEIGVG